MDDELTVEPLKRPRKSIRAQRDIRQDSQGQTVEYERGYLRRQAKLAHGEKFADSSLRQTSRPAEYRPAREPDCGVEILYVLRLPGIPCHIRGPLEMELWWRPQGQPGPLRPVAFLPETTVPTQADQALFTFLAPCPAPARNERGNRFLVPQEKQRTLCELLENAGALRWCVPPLPGAQRVLHPLAWQGKTTWSVKTQETLLPRKPFQLKFSLATSHGKIPLQKWQALSDAGWAIADNALHLLAMPQVAPKVGELLEKPLRSLTVREAREWCRLLELDGGADMTGVNPAFRVPKEMVDPVPCLYVTTARYKHLGQEQLQCQISFRYGDTRCQQDSTALQLLGTDQLFLRSPAQEKEFLERLPSLGFRFVKRATDEDPGWKLLPSLLDRAVRTLVLEDWEVTAEGRTYRRPMEKSFSVSGSGIDWLELQANLTFENGLKLETPQLLQALQKKTKAVRLDDGTYGILPQEWLEKFTALVEIGQTNDRVVRLRQEQCALVEALLKEQLQDAEGRYAATLERLRREDARPLEPLSPPPWFQGTLRPYQALFLGWAKRLADRGLSGILADDMGLGKTVQVLAMLALRHQESPAHPSLVVMPSSLLFNWESECHRFAPRLKAACHYGPHRQPTQDWFQQYDLVFTTYGTLRQDASLLAKIPLDCLILDESQAIKNAQSATAQAVRTLHAERRLAMTGTPVENHLEELFSQLSFLNPGLFRHSFLQSLGKENSILHDAETARRLQQAVAPFLLRRRKEEVAPELPKKTEQVLFCELSPQERECYDELRKYYQGILGGAATVSGNRPATASMLEALLRLRQAACHPALVNPAMAGCPSAKLTLLQERLDTLLDAGHKALVFSQFTTLLKMAATQLDAAGRKYEYLDGQTKDRKEVVRRFQEDPEKGVFLISLKAGGVGLNLVAADYVFLLDPWWNPAAEAQAIDRCYRIGQTSPVMAYRMIARDTVEGKVLQMQHTKRLLAALATTTGALASTPPELTADILRELLWE